MFTVEAVPKPKCCDICAPAAVEYHIPPQPAPKVTVPRSKAAVGQVNPTIEDCLRKWRDHAFDEVFGPTSLFGEDALIDDAEITRIARCAPILGPEHLKQYIPNWRFIDRLLESMWSALYDAGCMVLKSSPVPRKNKKKQAQAAETQAFEPATTSMPQSSTSTLRVPSTSTSTRSQSRPQPLARSWISSYMPERNYEVRESTIEDLERMFRRPPASHLSHPPPTPSAPPPQTKKYRPSQTQPMQQTPPTISISQPQRMDSPFVQHSPALPSSSQPNPRTHVVPSSSVHSLPTRRFQLPTHLESSGEASTSIGRRVATIAIAPHTPSNPRTNTGASQTMFHTTGLHQGKIFDPIYSLSLTINFCRFKTRIRRCGTISDLDTSSATFQPASTLLCTEPTTKSAAVRH